MTDREKLESEIRRLAEQEVKLIEHQNKLKRKTSAWTALEIKRIECSSYLAIYNMQLADMISNTRGRAKLYGVEYSSDTNPQYIIRHGLQKAGIDPTERIKVPASNDKSEKSIRLGGFWIFGAITICVLFVAFLIKIGNSNDDNDTSYADRLSEAKSMVSDRDAKVMIGNLVVLGHLPFSQLPQFTKILESSKYYYTDDLMRVKYAFVEVTGNPFPY